MENRSGLGGKSVVDTVAASGTTIASRNLRAPGGKPRTWGMLFTVTNDPTPANNITWYLKYNEASTNIFDNANWVDAATVFGGGSTPYTGSKPYTTFSFIDGITMDGKTLTAYYGYQSPDGVAEGASTFQWVRADDANGTNKVNIAGQVGATYTLAVADVGKYVSREITVVDANAVAGDVYTAPYVGVIDAKYYPGDNLTLVMGVYFRKLYAAYAGFCCRIQATNGGPTLDVGFVGDEPDWAAMIAFNAGGNVFMNIYYDQSGNGNNRTFANFGEQPQIDFVNKEIIWTPTKDGSHGAGATLNIGVNNCTLVLGARANQLLDKQITLFQKQTDFSNNHIGFQWSNYRFDNYLGLGTSLKSLSLLPGVQQIIAVTRDGVNRIISAGTQSRTDAEPNANITSANPLVVNTGSNGGGDWYERGIIWATTALGANYSKLEKYLLP
jgi:hypothetical protein